MVCLVIIASISFLIWQQSKKVKSNLTAKDYQTKGVGLSHEPKAIMVEIVKHGLKVTD
jgi:hypothetical protein